jgi:ribonucleotide reductase beta subunit family protein with ferritin-like domain
MQTPKQSYTFDYPAAIKAADTQMSIFWTHDEIHVDKDIQDIRVNMTEAEAHGVLTTLKLFTLYELIAGSEYWGRRVMRMFPRPDIHRMASAFSFFELNVHAPFYNKINEALMVNTDDFYLDYLNDPVLTERMEFIDGVVTSEDDLLSLAVFSMVEGAVLYSAFAFLLHFQSVGKNKLKNVCSGIKFSVRDENLHSEGGAWLYKQLLKEKMESGDFDHYKHEARVGTILGAAHKLREHEYAIIDKIFEKGDIKGISKQQMKDFVNHRINLCLSNLGIEQPKIECDISNWFYKQINSVQFHDFFAGQGNEYNRLWSQEKFSW